MTRCQLPLMYQSMEILLSYFPSDNADTAVGGAPPNASSDVGTSQSNTNTDARPVNVRFQRPFKISKEVARSIIVPLALLSQSIISIWLFIRRANRCSDAIYDHRILQLA